MSQLVEVNGHQWIIFGASEDGLPGTVLLAKPGHAHAVSRVASGSTIIRQQINA